MLDGAVFAGGIHRLKHHQHRMTVVGIEPLLQLCHRLHVLLQQGRGSLFFHTRGIVRVKIAHLMLLAGGRGELLEHFFLHSLSIGLNGHHGHTAAPFAYKYRAFRPNPRKRKYI